jgi:hypothetical protein
MPHAQDRVAQRAHGTLDSRTRRQPGLGAKNGTTSAPPLPAGGRRTSHASHAHSRSAREKQAPPTPRRRSHNGRTGAARGAGRLAPARVWGTVAAAGRVTALAARLERAPAETLDGEVAIGPALTSADEDRRSTGRASAPDRDSLQRKPQPTPAAGARRKPAPPRRRCGLTVRVTHSGARTVAGLARKVSESAFVPGQVAGATARPSPPEPRPAWPGWCRCLP